MWANSAVVQGIAINDIYAVNVFMQEDMWTRCVIHNRNGITYLKLGEGVSSSNYSFRLNKDAILELENYGGPITAIAANGSGYLDVTLYRG